MRKNFGAKPFLYPQPVMILGTYDENGKANAMNAAWGGIVGANEIIVDLSAHKTTDNIIKNKTSTCSIGEIIKDDSIQKPLSSGKEFTPLPLHSDMSQFP